MTGASLAVAMIGQALAQARGLVTKHAIKQVDRLLSNAASMSGELRRWCTPGRITHRHRRRHGLDGFRRRRPATLALNLVTGHGRAMPLLWLSCGKTS